MLSVDLDALATTMAHYSVSGGRTLEEAACRALHHVFADLADQARALEGRPAPRVVYEPEGNVVPLTPRRPPPPVRPGGSAA